jgi:hypothetical protein
MVLNTIADATAQTAAPSSSRVNERMKENDMMNNKAGSRTIRTPEAFSLALIPRRVRWSRYPMTRPIHTTG